MHFIDLAAQQKRIRRQLDERIKKVLDHGQYILGPEISELEEKLAAFVNMPFAVSVASGTDALLMPLMVEKVGPGDAIFTSTLHIRRHGRSDRIVGRDSGFRRHRQRNVQYRSR